MPDAQDSSTPSQFQGLIDTLRAEAVEEAEKEAGRILAAAEKRASQVLAEARAKADEMVSAAEKEAEKLQTAGEDALRRASRDVLLSMEAAITAQLEAVLHRETKSVLQGGELAVIVRTLVEKWTFDTDNGEVEILLSESDLALLEEAGWHGLKEGWSEGVAFRPVPDVEAGLRIGFKNGAVHYDFTAQTLAEWMGRFVTPMVREQLRDVSQEPK